MENVYTEGKAHGKEPLTFPDRVRRTVEACSEGTHMTLLGGWLSFNREMGKGGWGRTRLRDILPCECRETEDLRESAEGFVPRLAPGASTRVDGQDLSTDPAPGWGCNFIDGKGHPKFWSQALRRLLNGH